MAKHFIGRVAPALFLKKGDFDMRAAIYCRVSTMEQAKEGYSIRAQLNRLKAFAMSQDWTVAKQYVDEGQSAKDMNRPNLQEMLKDVEKELFDVVLVYRLDRLTRSVLDLHEMLNFFDQHNVKFKSATEVYDTTTATGRLFITIVAAMAQWERENTAERISFGMEQKAREGKWVVSMAPYGYKRNGDNLEIVEEEAAIVQKIYEMYLTGKYGALKIARYLNRSGIKKRGHGWGLNSVSYILRNPIYTGTMRYNYRVNKENYFEVEDAVPAIIRKQDFNVAQKILNRRTYDHPKKATSPYIFTSVLRCARCGGKMRGHMSVQRKTGKAYYAYSYHCVNKNKGLCDLPGISQNFLEIQFTKLIKDINVKNELASGAVNDQLQTDNNPEQIAALKKELQEIEKRKTKWQYAWANEMISDEEFKKRSDEEKARTDEIEEALKNLQLKSENKESREMLAQTLRDLQANWSELDVMEKKMFVNTIVDTMTVDKKDFKRIPESVAITDISFL